MFMPSPTKLWSRRGRTRRRVYAPYPARPRSLVTTIAATAKMAAEMMFPAKRMKEPLADLLATSMSAKGPNRSAPPGEDKTFDAYLSSEPAFSQ